MLSSYLRRTVLLVEPLPADIDTGAIPPRPSQHGATAAWRVYFDDDRYAGVRLQSVGVRGSAFPDLQARFYAQQDQWRDRAPSSDTISMDAVGWLDQCPYETYFQGRVLVSCEWQKEAVVEASTVPSPAFRETMAGIAVLALRLLKRERISGSEQSGSL